MNRTVALIAVVVAFASIAALLVDWPSVVAVDVKEVPGPAAKGGPEVHVTTAQDLHAEQRSAQAKPAADPGLRRPLQNLRERLANAETVAQVLALVDRRETPPDAEQRVLDEERYFAFSVQRSREKLLAHRAASDSGDPAHVLTDKKLQARLLSQELGLSALRRGDFYFGEGLSPLERFQTIEYGGPNGSNDTLVVVMKRDDSPLLLQLNREIHFAELVAEFNKMTEGTRRRVLKLRAESLRDDPPEEQGWLATYFPEGCFIDESTAMIH